MADQKISALNAKTTIHDTDLFPMVDIEAETDETKKITGANLKSQVLAEHKDLTTGVHGAGANTLLHTGSTGLITYDLCDKALLAYIHYRNPGRFIEIPFDTYDHVTSHTAGTGSVTENFFNPTVASGTTSGGAAALYHDTAWFYPYVAGYTSVFITSGKMNNDTTDSTGFIGCAQVAASVVAKDDDSYSHAGFLFYVSGATKKVYAQSSAGAGGGAVEQTDLGLAPTDFATYAMIGDGDGHLYFYVDWVLKATHDTYLPSGTHTWKISVVCAENADNIITARNFVYTHAAN